jgi:predicted Fe-Mo cluster-binding NifX family protein
MRIAVTSQGDQLTSSVDPRFGRANCFLVMDTETGKQHVVDNSDNVNASQGAGVQAAQSLVDMHVDAVMTGHCGPRAFQVLEAAGIKVYLGVEGTVQSAIDRLESGPLADANGPSVEGHW